MISKWIYYRNYFIAKLISRLIGQSDKILDVGAGDGILGKLIHHQDKFIQNINWLDQMYFPIDINPTAFWVEKKDILTIPKSCFNKTFSVIVLQEVLEHLSQESIFTLLPKLKAWLNDNGILVISVPNIDRLTNRVSFNPEYLDQTHVLEYKDGILDYVLKLFGFEIIEKHYIILYLPFEKYIGWIVPDILRRHILTHHPTWASHFVYVLSKDIKENKIKEKYEKHDEDIHVYP